MPRGRPPKYLDDDPTDPRPDPKTDPQGYQRWTYRRRTAGAEKRKPGRKLKQHWIPAPDGQVEIGRVVYARADGALVIKLDERVVRLNDQGMKSFREGAIGPGTILSAEIRGH